MDVSVKILDGNTNEAYHLMEKVAPILIRHDAEGIFERGSTMTGTTTKIQIYGYLAGLKLAIPAERIEATKLILKSALENEIKNETGVEAVILS